MYDDRSEKDMDSTYSSIIEKTRKINIKLRKESFRITPKLHDIRRMPFYGTMINGMPTDSLGPFPEFILPTHPCSKTLQGFCSPCFFSKVPMSGCNSRLIYESLIVQTQYIIENFDDIILKYQARDDVLKDVWDVTFCYACNGSLFSNSETTPHDRYTALKMLSDEIEKRHLRALVYLETCVFDYLVFLQSPEFPLIYPLLKKLNAVILFGFESSNYITRNLIYLKDLELENFEKAVEENQRLGLVSGAFLYLGFHSMTQNEIIIDARNSLEYLRNLNVMPVLMFPNIHEYTLTHLLYTYKRYNLIDPQTALSIYSYAVQSTKGTLYSKQHRCDAWLMGDLFGGPPPPPNNFFNNKFKVSCDECSELVRTLLQEARKTHGVESVERVKDRIKLCRLNCGNNYIKAINDEDINAGNTDLISRIVDNINFAEEHCEEYIEIMRKGGTLINE